MKHTDDNPKILRTVSPAMKSQGPIGISNHSRYGFNVRHFYMDWQTDSWQATKKGVSVEPGDALQLVLEMIRFINEVEIYPGRRFRLTEVKDDDESTS